jgi:hypothetical protein
MSCKRWPGLRGRATGIARSRAAMACGAPSWAVKNLGARGASRGR